MNRAPAPRTDAPEGLGLRMLRSVSNLVCLCRDERITWINPAGATLLGAEEEALVGRAFPEFVSADYAELMGLGLATFAEEEGGVPLKLVPVDGEGHDVKLFVTALDDPAGGAEPSYMVEAVDITEYLRAAEATRLREQRLKGILDTVAEGIIAINEKGGILAYNPAAERLFGYPSKEMMGRNVSQLMPESLAGQHDEFIRRYQESGEKHAIGTTREVEGRRKDGSLFPMELSVSELREGRSRAFIGAMRDITERKAYEDRIKHLAHHDPLTGLPNRNLYQDRLVRAVARAYRSGSRFALMFVDLDRFKPINDSFGHEAGDAVLTAVAERLRNSLRASDTVARLGGDEFVAILENLHSRDDAAKVAANLLDRLAAPVPWQDQQLSIGASIGISLYPDDAKDAETLTQCADAAMYRVKEAGRNAFRFYEG